MWEPRKWSEREKVPGAVGPRAQGMQKLLPELRGKGHPSKGKEIGGKQHGVWNELWAPESKVPGEKWWKLTMQRWMGPAQRASHARPGRLNSLGGEGHGSVLCNGAASFWCVILTAELEDKFEGHKTAGGETSWEAISSLGMLLKSWTTAVEEQIERKGYSGNT